MDKKNKLDINKLQNIIIAYKLPFALDLKNCSKQEDEGNPFLIISNNIPAQLRTERNYNEAAIGEGVKIAPYSKLNNDRYGMLSRTSVQIWFDHKTFDNPNLNKGTLLVNDKYFFNLSLDYLNKFLSDYRRITREFWIRPIRKQDILSYTYILLDTDKNKEIVSILLNNPVNFHGGREISISEESETALRNLLISEHVNLQDDLLLSAFDSLDLGNYNATVIQCAILFENFIYSSLKSRLSKTKLEKIKRNPKCNCLVGIYQVCKAGLKDEFGSSFGESQEFEKFHENVLKIRNDLVHGEKLKNVEPAKAREAIEHTIKAIEKFKKVIKNS